MANNEPAKTGNLDTAAARLRRIRRFKGKLAAARGIFARLYTQIDACAFLPRELEWLADNRYILDRELAALDDIMLKAGQQASASRVYLICRQAVEEAWRHGYTLDEESLCRLLSAPAEKLSERELSLLAPALKLSALCFLADHAPALSESAAQAAQGQRRTNAALSDAMAFGIGALRSLSSADFEKLHARVSAVEAQLCLDPSGAYAGMDEYSRACYRARAAQLARRCGLTESACARKVLALAQAHAGDARRGHVGYYLFCEPLGKAPRRTAPGLYLALTALMPVLAAAALAYAGCGYFALIAYPVLLDLWIRLENPVFLRFMHPVPVFSMEAQTPLADDARTLCVIAALATSGQQAQALAEKLGEYALAAKGGKNLYFGLLLDLREADSPAEEEDTVILSAAAQAIAALNAAQGERFYLLTRPRQWSGSEQAYIPRERKRGALEALCALLRGGDSELTASSPLPPDIRYLATLDADTEPAIDALVRAVSALRHPLSRPVVADGRVCAGHALMQPRLSRALCRDSLFAEAYAGQGGFDAYGAAAPDFYQNLCGETNFTGKGVFDIDAYMQVLHGVLPAGRILSHDLLEGAYLRAGFCPQAEFFEDFPQSAGAYFGREHRWIRGDWQAGPWMFPSVKTGGGKRVPNPLPACARLRIFDNLRRSLRPVFQLALIFIAVYTAAPDWLFVLAALSFLPDLLGCTVMPREEYRARIPGALVRTMRRTLYDFCFLPKAACTALDAAFRALWRMHISRRHLLQWRTAMQVGAGKTGAAACIWGFAPCVAAGILLMLPPYTGYLLTLCRVLAALCWISAPAAAFFSSKTPPVRNSPLDEPAREWILAQSERMYGYFRDNVCDATHFLPPDNVQFKPAQGVARRTSPTNIGLAMLSFAAAKDLGFATQEEMLSRLEAMTATLEGMEKWHGNLYNWYSTDTAAPMYPRRVSTVDSGNLLGCLIALEAALHEAGGPRAGALAARIHALSAAMELAPLYDPVRRLMRLGYDAEHNKPDDSYYDLLASEARLASYIAVARGEADMRHWLRLGRLMGGLQRRRGLLSWSGTMFEYLMPALLMPSYEGSLLYESEYFALYCQKKRFKTRPYGVSESCFFAFDSDMNFQYKAHGVQALGLKRGLDREAVIAPYAAWLTLALDAQEAYENLRSFDALDAAGLWGHYEALDFTRSRIPEGSRYMPIRCFMAHHVGMSLIAAANVLSGGVWQRRFFADAAMRAHSSLLKERVPVGTPLRARPQHYAREPRGAVEEMELGRSRGIVWQEPACVMLSNGGIRVLATSLGIARIVCAGEDLVAFDPRHLSGAGGVHVLLALDDALYSLTPAPFFAADVGYDVRFTPAYAEYSAKIGEVTAKLRVSVCAEEKAVQFALRLDGVHAQKAHAVLAFAPVLDELRAFTGHPAFSKLFLSAHVVKESPAPALAVSRRTRSGAPGTSAALACSQAAVFETSRERALGRAGLFGLLQIPAASAADSGAPDPYAAAYVPLTPGSGAELRFALGCAAREADAVEAACSALDYGPGVESHRMYELLEALGMEAKDAQQAFSLYARALYLTPALRRQAKYLEKLKAGRSFLWRFGISGDYPVLVMRAEGESAVEKALRAHMFLYLCGAYCDLAALNADGGYLRGGYSSCVEILREWGGESLLGQRAGVHLIDEDRLSPQDREQLYALADLVLEGEDGAQQDFAQEQKLLPLTPDGGMPPDRGRVETPCVIDRLTASFEARPALVWSHPLANERFGYLACDSGAGNMWYRNSRENRVNRWENDPLACTGPENVELVTQKGRTSLFSRGGECQVRYRPGFAEWESRIEGIHCTLRAFVHPKLPARVLELTLDGDAAAQAHVLWHTTLLLGEGEEARRYVRTSYDAAHGVVEAANPSTQRFAPYRFICTAYPAAQAFTCDEAAFRAGVLDGACGAGLDPCTALRIEPERAGSVYRAWIVCGCAADAQEAGRIAALCAPAEAKQAARQTEEYWRRLCADLTVETPDKRINAIVNGFAAYQVLAGRLFARSSMYQSSGAYGFRDQLQDAAGLLFLPPDAQRHALVRQQILRAAGHQYREGDVQHWWHPDGLDAHIARGVRTRVSDDLLFLPYVALLYVEKTGDNTILDETAPWLDSAPLAPEEHERLEEAPVSPDGASVWEHCRRVLTCVMARGCGAHGLAHIGGGDWNDAMNAVGIAGRGESVWLSWFAALVFDKMAAHGGNRCDADTIFAWQRFSRGLTDAAYAAWDGDHFLRGWYDDGTPIGSAQSDACKIDAISQAFCAFVEPPAPASAAEAAQREVRRIQALRSAVRDLYDGTVVRLFDPPFSTASKQEPGYIKGYTPGVRENGGQYTHGAIWLAMGLLRAGLADDGARMLASLAPSQRRGYRAEPYYIAADVYSAPELYGRAGWTIYTGAAGWYLRAVLDELLGLHFLPGRLEIAPRLPSSWQGYEARYEKDGACVRIRVRRGQTPQLYFDGAPCAQIPWPPAPGEHEADVVIQ